ncbi:hypothetical protein AB3X52_07595 [Nocardioides sp. DS6]|uniref:Cell division protein FtsL n=1 Tax=Nocardioides eburneus TaxID=3231482 RepID=A0ABV3SX13_9ACTN
MSSTAAQQVRSRLAPLLEGRERVRLTVVPDRRSSAARLPFVVLVSVILVGGVVGLLCFNTSMQQAAFAENKLQEQATNLAARQESLSSQIQRLQDPQNIAARAQRLGMVIPASPALIHVPNGKVEGTAVPADRSATPPLYPRIAKPAYAVTPPATTTQAKTDRHARR